MSRPQRVNGFRTDRHGYATGFRFPRPHRPRKPASVGMRWAIGTLCAWCALGATVLLALLIR